MGQGGRDLFDLFVRLFLAMLLDRMCDLCNRKRNQADPKKCVELRDRGTKAELRVSGESRVGRTQ